MIDILLGLLGGAVLGAIYFGGLWLTVRDINQTERAAGRLFVSFLLRSAVVLVGFYLVLQLGLMAMGAALVAFVGVRVVATRQARVPEEV